jgi:hypothetical protein
MRIHRFVVCKNSIFPIHWEANDKKALNKRLNALEKAYPKNGYVHKDLSSETVYDNYGFDLSFNGPSIKERLSIPEYKKAMEILGLNKHIKKLEDNNLFEAVLVPKIHHIYDSEIYFPMFSRLDKAIWLDTSKIDGKRVRKSRLVFFHVGDMTSGYNVIV